MALVVAYACLGIGVAVGTVLFARRRPYLAVVAGMAATAAFGLLLLREAPRVAVGMGLGAAPPVPIPIPADPEPEKPDDPRGTVERLLQRIEAVTNDDAIVRELDRFLDYEAMARATLPECAPQCEAFSAALAGRLRRSQLSRLRGAHIEVVGVDVRGDKAKIDTTVQAPAADPVEVDYVVHNVDGQWRCRNVITDGVSLVRSYRYELAALRREGGMDRVLAALAEG